MTTPLVRAADIAAMANVSRAAVTQWRKRHKDFPRPKEDVDSDSPLFDRVEVEEWLAARGRTPNSRASNTAEGIAHKLTDYLRGFVEPQLYIEIVGAGLVFEYITRALADGHGLDRVTSQDSDRYDQLHANRPDTLAGLRGGEMAEWLQRLLTTSDVFSEALSPLDVSRPEVSSLLKTLAAETNSLPLTDFISVNDTLIINTRSGSIIDPAPLTTLITALVGLHEGTVLDPAIGAGSTLLALGRNTRLTLVGVDVDTSVLAIARRRAILTNQSVDLRLGNSLGTDPAAGVLADAVVVNPPWGLRDFGPDVDFHNPRWIFGRPALRSESVWLQQAVEHLADDGRAFVVTTRSELFRSGQAEATRQELIRRGAVEAIIGLPPGLFEPFAQIQTALWVLARPGHGVDPDRLLLIDIAATSDRTINDGLEYAAQQYRSWRTQHLIKDTTHAVLVPVRELLELGTDLTPNTWLSRRDAPSAQELVDRIAKAHLAVESMTAPSVEPLPEFTATSAVRREKLTALPGVTIHRGTFRRSTNVRASAGIPLLTGQLLHHYGTSGEIQASEFIDPNTADAPITRPGDIVIFSVSRVPAHKIDLEGWAVPPSAYLVRVEPDSPFDIDYLVACINANARQQSSQLRGELRVVPSRLQIPVIPLADQHLIGRTIRDLEAVASATQHRLERLRGLIDLIAIASGAGSLGTSP
ncbi:N-6 DNA methylase [Antrihabitans sp. YC2-6]|uniref:N-6 DNA methylase n=1 Tax=Antrihabitans sp. YC2-6 TaxID=2799498 RepID=UPI0018F2F67E|nr:N-6 DNA methylase [Antrihabitans sp. YC2-6]MBJ8347615.1 N-6 DNA methylase [Antrihabitans sp. YC2-6]